MKCKCGAEVKVERVGIVQKGRCPYLGEVSFTIKCDKCGLKTYEYYYPSDAVKELERKGGSK